MKTEGVFVLLASVLVSGSNGFNDLFADEYIEEVSRNADLESQPSFRDYAYDYYEKNRRNVNDDLDDWNGRWMPDRPGDPTPPPKVFPASDRAVVSQTLHGVQMGRPSANCDDAKTNLTVDWDGSPITYTCYDKRIVPNRSAVPIKYCEPIPKYYVAMHKCMYEKIEYDDDVPLYGSHRPLWPVYGEYKYLPKQRWLHNLEHGAIAALYHPCANPQEVKRFKSLVTSCLHRHVITPYDRLDEQRPFVLVAWGCRLSMSYVNSELMVRFIREHALQGPENIARDGDYVDGLLNHAKIVSNLEDAILCPNARDI